MESTDDRRASAIGLALLALALLGGLGLYALQTAQGPGLQVDSVTYVSSANAIQDDPTSFYSLKGSDSIGDYDHFPPGYPLAIAVFRWLGLSLLTAARLVGALSLVGTLVGVFLVVRRASSPIVAGSAALALVALTGFVAEGYSWVMSDGYFLALAMGVLLLVDSLLRSDQQGRRWWAALVVIGLVTGYAGMTRFVGMYLLAFAALAVLLVAKRKPLLSAVVLGGSAAVVILPWYVSNWASDAPTTGGSGSKRLLWHPPGRVRAERLGTAVGRWFLPDRIATRAWPLVALVVVLAGVAAVVVLTRSRWRGLSGARLTVTLMLLMTVLFLAIVGVATAVYNPQPNTDQRNLLLLPVAAAVVIGIVGPRLFRRAPLQRFAPFALPAVALLLLPTALSNLGDTKTAHDDGLGYSGRAWAGSETLRYVAGLPRDQVISTTAQDVIYLRQGRITEPLPKTCGTLVDGVHLPTGECQNGVPAVADYRTRLQAALADLHARDGLIVLIDDSQRSTDPTLEELRLVARLTTVERFDDGVVLRPSPRP